MGLGTATKTENKEAVCVPLVQIIRREKLVEDVVKALREGSIPNAKKAYCPEGLPDKDAKYLRDGVLAVLANEFVTVDRLFSASVAVIELGLSPLTEKEEEYIKPKVMRVMHKCLYVDARDMRADALAATALASRVFGLTEEEKRHFKF